MREYRDVGSGSSSVDGSSFERYSNVSEVTIPFENEVDDAPPPTAGVAYVSHRQFHLLDHQRHDHEAEDCVAHCSCAGGSCAGGSCPCADRDGQLAFVNGRLRTRRPYPLDCCGARCGCAAAAWAAAAGSSCSNRLRLALPRLTVFRAREYGPGWAVRAAGEPLSTCIPDGRSAPARRRAAHWQSWAGAEWPSLGGAAAVAFTVVFTRSVHRPRRLGLRVRRRPAAVAGRNGGPGGGPPEERRGGAHAIPAPPMQC